MIRFIAIATVLAFSALADAGPFCNLLNNVQARRDARRESRHSFQVQELPQATQSSTVTAPSSVIPQPLPSKPAVDPFDESIGKPAPKVPTPTKLYLPRGHHLPDPPYGKVWTRLSCSPAGCEYVLSDKK